jgi:murein L,D-transpeptidase YafK
VKILTIALAVLALTGCHGRNKFAREKGAGSAAPTPKPAPAPIDTKPIAADLAAWQSDEKAQSDYEFDQARRHLWANGQTWGTVKIAADGEYEIVVTAAGQAALDELPKFKLLADDKLVGAETTLTSEDPTAYTFKATLKAGDRKIAVEFTNDVYKEGEYDRNLFVHGVVLRRVK